MKNTGKVEIFIPKTSKGDCERYIAVNGRRTLVKTGVPVFVAPEIAEVYGNSQKQRERADEKIRSFSTDGI